MIYIDDDHFIKTIMLMDYDVEYNPTLFMQEIGNTNRYECYPIGRKIELKFALTQDVVQNGFFDIETIYRFSSKLKWF